MKFPQKTYRGVDAAEVFLKELLKEEEKLLCLLQQTEPMKMNKMEEEVFLQSSHCHICKEVVDVFDKVRDHDHITGIFRGAAHSSCNINYRTVDKIPVVFHNLKGYDSHIISQAIGNVKTKEPEVLWQKT